MGAATRKARQDKKKTAAQSRPSHVPSLLDVLPVWLALVCLAKVLAAPDLCREYCGLGAVAHVELVDDAPDGLLHRGLTQEEALADLCV